MVTRIRILVAEQSDATRVVAETVLRQSGFELISVASADKALEVLKLTRPELMIIGADLKTSDQRPLYDRLQTDPQTSSIALLLFDDPGGSDLPFPTEVIIPRPLDPKEFLEKVIIFSGAIQPQGDQNPSNPLGEASLDDELLDSALGLDRIDVTDSEVMDKKESRPASRPSPSEGPSVGLQHDDKHQQAKGDARKVETVMIRDRSGLDHQPHTAKGKTSPAHSSSGKLEILSDQYALTDPNALKADADSGVHDYDWFINEMRKDTGTPKATSVPESQPTVDQTSSSELKISDPAAMVDPVTMPSVSTESATDQTKSGGVEKFIDEFKKEVEKAQTDEPETVYLEDEGQTDNKAHPHGQKWEESFENVTPDEIGMFTRQLCSELAEKIAARIVAKIDSDKLLNLLKNEILTHSRNKV